MGPLGTQQGNERNKTARWGCVLCRLLNVFDNDHCQKTIEEDEGERLV